LIHTQLPKDNQNFLNLFRGISICKSMHQDTFRNQMPRPLMFLKKKQRSVSLNIEFHWCFKSLCLGPN